MDEVTCCFFHIWIEETVHGNQICLVVMSWFSSAISNMFLLKMFVVLFKKNNRGNTEKIILFTVNIFWDKPHICLMQSCWRRQSRVFPDLFGHVCGKSQKRLQFFLVSTVNI